MKKTTKVEKSINSQAMLYSAKGFFEIGWAIALELKNSTNEEKFEKVAPASVNLIFSVELLLKYLSIQEAAKVPETHNLVRLFRNLSPSLQKNIKDQFDVLTNQENNEKPPTFMLSSRQPGTPLPQPETKDLNTFLDHHQDSFASWRYFFELKNMEYFIYSDFNSIRCFYEALSHVIDIHTVAT